MTDHLKTIREALDAIKPPQASDEVLRMKWAAKAAVTALEQAQPYKGRDSYLDRSRIRINPVTGDVSLGTPAQQAQPTDLQAIEQYRMQMAAISTAALGYWEEGDSIHPDYDTVALRDVAKLYAKYDELYRKQAQAEAVPAVTPAMVDAYLKANTAYWQQQDELPKPPAKWINGTPQEATRVSLIAALAAAPQQAEAVPQTPADWSVFNNGAEVASGLTWAEAWDYMTPERIDRGWTAVCVADKSNLAAAPQPKEQSNAVCRSDGKCQYAIDHDAEKLGHCPTGKCVMPRQAETALQPKGGV